MAPEALSQRLYNTKTDVWSFGVTIYEILTHKVPYEELDLMQTCGGVMMGTVSLLPKIEAKELEYPGVLVMVMKQCLVRDPAERTDFTQVVEIFDLYQH